MTNNSNAGSAGTGRARDNQQVPYESTTSKRDYQTEKVKANAIMIGWLHEVNKRLPPDEAHRFVSVPAENFDQFYALKLVTLGLLPEMQEIQTLEQIAQISRRPIKEIQGYIVYDFGNSNTRSDFGEFVALEPQTARVVGIGVWQAVLTESILDRLANKTGFPEEVISQCAKRQLGLLHSAVPVANKQAKGQSAGSLS